MIRPLAGRWWVALTTRWEPWALLAGVAVTAILTLAIVTVERRDVRRIEQAVRDACLRGEALRSAVRYLIAVNDPDRTDATLQRFRRQIASVDCKRVGR